MSRRTYALEKRSVTWAFLSPWLLTLALFWAYPLIRSFYLSFTRYNTLSNKTTWIGGENYERMLGDDIFWTALSNTMIFVVGTIPFTTLIALTLAVLLNRNIAWRDVYRAAYFIPSVTSIVVLSLIFYPFVRCRARDRAGCWDASKAFPLPDLRTLRIRRRASQIHISGGFRPMRADCRNRRRGVVQA